MLQWLFATLHLLALGCGLGALAARARNLAPPLDAAALTRCLRADNWWRLSLLLWLCSGAGLAYYHAAMLWQQGRPVPLAMAKLLGMLLLLLLEWRIRPLLCQCRQRLERGRLPAEELCSQLAGQSRRQLLLLLLLLMLSSAWQSGAFNTP
ncbi:DUF2214 family protein [Aquitalea sp. ASV15]|uniref:DUF2214 family protein n=1 Tax=Aquitalea sp. ASV15 TaxID=2795104 RepID=UPI0018EC039E|nr:DUF2214 family protein [Aquitalea sp. ASV15]